MRRRRRDLRGGSSRPPTRTHVRTATAVLLGQPALPICGRLALSVPPPDGRVCLVGHLGPVLGRCLVPEPGLVDGVAAPVGPILVLTRADRDDDAAALAGADDGVRRVGWAVHEVPRAQRTLLAFDDEKRFAVDD